MAHDVFGLAVYGVAGAVGGWSAAAFAQKTGFAHR
jgi:hypothetical protein